MKDRESSEGEGFRFRDLPGALWFFLDKERWRYLFFLFVLLCVMFYTMVPPFLIGSIANYLIELLKTRPVSASIAPADPALLKLLGLVGALAASHAAVALVRLTSKRMLGRISLNARYRAKVWGFERLLDYSLAWHQRENTGNKAQRILTGAEAVREWTGDVVNQLTQGFASFTGSLAACMLLHPAFALFFAYYLATLIGIEAYYDRRISRLSDRINKSMENASGSFVESASNILAVKAMGASLSMTGSIARREELARELAYQRLRLVNSKWMRFQIHNSLSWGAYLVVIGLMVMKGRLLPGFFLTYAAYFDRMRESSVEFTDRIQLMIERKSNLGRMMPIFRGKNTLVSGKLAFPADWSFIELRRASFSYSGRGGLGPLDLRIRRGEKIGLAGPSGSGKSSLIKLLLGLYHLDSGELEIGGRSLSDIRHEELTANVAVVLQETELFNFSLKDNITMLREVEPEVLERACRAACLEDLIGRLPEGLEAVVGEKGYALSGGERQRVGIARALCRQAPILLLDEATSALDSLTERRVTERLMEEGGADRTMLIVAHRISTLRGVDRIIVFEGGRIAEEGDFESLAKDSSTRFGAMYALQQA